MITNTTTEELYNAATNNTPSHPNARHYVQFWITKRYRGQKNCKLFLGSRAFLQVIKYTGDKKRILVKADAAKLANELAPFMKLKAYYELCVAPFCGPKLLTYQEVTDDELI